VSPAAPTMTSKPSPAWAEFAVLMLVCFVASGAPAPHVNETHYLLKAKHYWDPSFCPGDVFLDSADAHLPFYWTVGWLTRVMPLAAAAWVARVAAWTLISAGWMRLTRAVTAAPWAAAFSGLVWLALVDLCDFAGEWVVGGLHGRGGVEGKSFAYGLILFGWAALAAGRWTAPWIWFGAAASMHVVVGGWAVVAGLGAWLMEPKRSRPAIAALLPGLVIGGLAALPGLLPALALDRSADASQAHEAARIYVYERLPHHLAPHTLAGDEFARRAVRFGALVAALAAVAAWVRSNANDLATSNSLCQPPAIQRVLRFATASLMINCLGMAIELALDNRRLVAAPLLRFYWYRLSDVIVPAAVALAGTCLAIELLRRQYAWARLGVAVALLACTGRMVAIAADRWRNPLPPAVSRMEHADSWLAACDWIRRHAPADAVCLIPRHAQSFKWFAQRADVANWKDVPQDVAGVLEWRRRIHDVFPTVEGPAGPVVLNSPEQWGARRALDVARRYGATYVVARSEPPLGLEEVFAATSPDDSVGYSVYRVDDSSPPSPANRQP
jgi:hypothetical protein